MILAVLEDGHCSSSHCHLIQCPRLDVRLSITSQQVHPCVRIDFTAIDLCQSCVFIWLIKLMGSQNGQYKPFVGKWHRSRMVKEQQGWVMCSQFAQARSILRWRTQIKVGSEERGWIKRKPHWIRSWFQQRSSCCLPVKTTKRVWKCSGHLYLNKKWLLSQRCQRDVYLLGDLQPSPWLPALWNRCVTRSWSAQVRWVCWSLKVTGWGWDEHHQHVIFVE